MDNSGHSAGGGLSVEPTPSFTSAKQALLSLESGNAAAAPNKPDLKKGTRRRN